MGEALLDLTLKRTVEAGSGLIEVVVGAAELRIGEHGLNDRNLRRVAAEIFDEIGVGNLDAGRNSLPIDRKATIRQQFELKGPHARVQVHVPLPEIFVKINVDQEPNADEQHAKPIVAADRFRILRLEPTEASRVLGKVEVSVLGKQRQSQQFVSTRIESISGGWLKVIPVGNLDPGEYALVEMLGQNEFNSYVWDFGVDPKAPDNPNAEKPESPANEDDID